MTPLQRHIEEVGQTALARRLDVTRGAVSHWKQGLRVPSPAMARRIAQRSGGKIKAADIRPDIFKGVAA